VTQFFTGYQLIRSVSVPLWDAIETYRQHADRAVVLRSTCGARVMWRVMRGQVSVCHIMYGTIAVHCGQSGLGWDDANARQSFQAAARLQRQSMPCRARASRLHTCTADWGVFLMLCYWQFTVPTPLNFILCSAVRLWLFAFVLPVILLRVWFQFSVGFPAPTWLTVNIRCDNELLTLDYAFQRQSRSSSWQSSAMILLFIVNHFIFGL